MKAASLKFRGILLATAVVSLVGYTDFFFKDDALDNAESFSEEVKSTMRPSKDLQNMETIEMSPYIPYRYRASSSTNPFTVKNFVSIKGMSDVDASADVCADASCGDGPPVPHAPYFLENYNIDQLAMIGTMKDRSRGKVALIETPNAGVVYARQGEYLGRNNGLILSIDSDRVIIREKYRSPLGWQDRMARILLLKK